MSSLEPVLKLSRKLTTSSPYSSILQGTSAVLIILGVICGLIGISLSFCFQYSDIDELIRSSLLGLVDPFQWIKVPSIENRLFLLLPTAILLGVTQIIIKCSPRPQVWSRVIIASILIALTLRYILWRTLETLNFSNYTNGFFSLLLWLLEMLVLSSSLIQLYLIFTIKNRRNEADFYSQAVIQKQYLPSIDILVPTYNESEFILRRTLIGCQAINYANKTIYILDDMNRDNIKNLADELGCHYMSRLDHRHAKAGNLNHALEQTQGELVVVFDADFIPCTNFLERTVGFFQKDKIALIQTPQSFYNADPIAYNLGLENIVTPEGEVFYRYIQPIKDGAGGVVCAGTSFVVRREALESVGYFNTESLSEDYFTGIELSAQGYQVIYLDEKLSAGLAAESLSTHLTQRLRWARGTLQAFFIRANPLTISGLNLRQRLAHLEGLLFWFSSLPRLLFLLIPLLSTFFDIAPLKITPDGALYIFIPYLMTQIGCYHWLNFRSRSVVFSEISSSILCVPTAFTVISVLFKPFDKRFKVTPKGITRTQYVYNWKLAFPLLILLVATGMSIGMNLQHHSVSPNEINIGLILGSYNVLTITTALVALLDLPRSIDNYLLSIQSSLKITIDSCITMGGVLKKLSEMGAEIWLNEPVYLQNSVMIDIFEQDLKLFGTVARVERQGTIWQVLIKFDQLSLAQQRQLITFIFCYPGRWPVKQTPGELKSLWLLLRSLLRGVWLLGRLIISPKIDTKCQKSA